MKTPFFPSYIFYWVPSGPLPKMWTADMTSPPEGGEQAPNFGPSFGGPARPTALPIPHADKRRVAPPGDACGIVVAPMALVASLRPRIPAYQGAQVAAVWVGTSRPASWACGRAKASGCAETNHRARGEDARTWAAYGCKAHRATSDRVQRLRPLLAGRQ